MIYGDDWCVAGRAGEATACMAAAGRQSFNTAPSGIGHRARPRGLVATCQPAAVGKLLHRPGRRTNQLSRRSFGTKPTDWLGRTSPKLPVLYRVGRKTSINYPIACCRRRRGLFPVSERCCGRALLIGASGQWFISIMLRLTYRNEQRCGKCLSK